ncbi:[Wnt protein] O-palmitoleoyl-L-serine hydrolase [Salvia divinorum]|uniref:[Wnt protein] O-palmitoleoyl-L-serine hydrolase n=1 Tax=Salvia divinorum TaxID=28513 RepID=A0ABD1H567_SALDI
MDALLLAFAILSLVAVGIDGYRNVTISILDLVVAKGADDTPPVYAYSPGFGDGIDNWHVYLQTATATASPSLEIVSAVVVDSGENHYPAYHRC